MTLFAILLWIMPAAARETNDIYENFDHTDGYWLMTFIDGQKPNRTMYFTDAQSIKSFYSPQAQAALDAAGPKTNSASLAKMLTDSQRKSVTTMQVFEAEDSAKLRSVQRDLIVNCQNRSFVIAKTVRTYDDLKGFLFDVRKETETSEKWQTSNEPWAIQAVNVVCQERIWRRGMASSAYWLACNGTNISESAQCKEAYLRYGRDGDKCDPAVMIKLKLVCIGILGRDAVSKYARDHFFDKI